MAFDDQVAEEREAGCGQFAAVQGLMEGREVVEPQLTEQ
mgnify:CR=1 FL=1